VNALEVRGLRVHFATEAGRALVVEDTSFELLEGETLALVGESGAGKTVTSLAVMGLLPSYAVIETGEILLGERNLLTLSAREMRRVRGREIGMIFQDPMTSLNPLLTVGQQLVEVLRVHAGLGRREARTRCAAALGEVGLAEPEDKLEAYPHELSGGMRQRVMIAMALLCRPKVLIADEPTTALDVTVQAQILDLMRDLQEQHGTAILMISHDLGVVAGVAHQVAVMYAGGLVERGRTADVFQHPHHPYTFGLLRAVPTPATPTDEPLPTILGQPPDPTEVQAGCPFQPRCPFRVARCAGERPKLEAPRVAEDSSMRAARMLFVGGRRAACFEKERVAALTALWVTALDWTKIEAPQLSAEDLPEELP
jgi:oligopeptide/dipeptide ABC transporter ATP-binding protein